MSNAENYSVMRDLAHAPRSIGVQSPLARVESNEAMGKFPRGQFAFTDGLSNTRDSRALPGEAEVKGQCSRALPFGRGQGAPGSAPYFSVPPAGVPKDGNGPVTQHLIGKLTIEANCVLPASG